MPPSAFRVKQILAEMRQRLVAGFYSRGIRLPVRDQLQAEFHTSPAAVQQAINTLREDGQIISIGKLGSYVADQPPCLDSFAWMYPEPLPAYRRRILYTQLRSACLQQNTEPGMPNHVWFYGLSPSMNPDARAQIDAASAAIAHRRVAALIFPVGGFGPWVNDFTRHWPEIPTVRFSHSLGLDGPTQAEITLPTLALPLGRFITHALDHLRERGIQRVGLWTLGKSGTVLTNLWGEQLAMRGMETDPLWQIALGEDCMAPQVECILRLMQACPRGLPEAFVITDDAVLGAITTALYNLKIRVPGSLELVAYAHFPGSSENPYIPCVLIGYPITDILAACEQLIRRQQLAPGSNPFITPRLETQGKRWDY